MNHRPNRIKDISGKRFGRLVVLSFSGRETTPCGSVKTTYECVCDCGEKIITKRSNLVNGYTKSCGCIVSEKLIDRNTKHNMTKTPEYKTWQNMLNRCRNTNSKGYMHYGGRGIKVCKEWIEKFENFYNDMGDRPKGMSIDRIDPDGNYSKSNCRWATNETQSKNKRKSWIIEYKGKSLPLKDWSDLLGINYYTLHSRIHRKKLPPEIAFNINKENK